MQSYNLSILGQEVSFRTNADEKRIKEAEKLIEQRFDKLNTHGSRLTNEKLLILVALSLADDFLQSNQELNIIKDKINQLLEKIDIAKSTIEENK